MPEVCRLIWLALLGAFRSRVSLEAENTILRHQLNVLRRQSPKRPTFGMLDRLIFAGLYRLAPKVLGALAIVKPETVIKWHRAGFRSYWRWKSRGRGGRPTVAPEIRKLIREMSIANPLWGAPRVHGELLKLGIAIGQTSVAKYMVKPRGPPSQGWKTFLRNHADGIAAIDLFVVPTISFRLLYGLLIMGHGRRQVIWLGVTTHPTAEWIANQLTEACGWQQLPRYLIRDRDAAYGDVFIRRVRSMGIRDQPTSPRSPWQSGYAERLSTDGQSLTAQVTELKAVGCVEIYQEKVSGAKSDRKQLSRLIGRLGDGDVLVVTRLDRLSRSTKDLLNLLGAVADKGAGFKSLRDTWADPLSIFSQP